MFKRIITTILLTTIASVAAASCQVKDTRVCAVFEKAQKFQATRGIIWRENSSTPTVAAEYEWALGPADVVHLGNTRYFEDDAVFFLIAHELGHSVKHHGRQFLEAFATDADRALPDRELVQKYAKAAMENDYKAGELSRKQELEADEFAIQLMLENGMDPVKAMKNLLQNRAGSEKYPSRRQRLAQAEQIAKTYRPTTTTVAALQ